MDKVNRRYEKYVVHIQFASMKAQYNHFYLCPKVILLIIQSFVHCTNPLQTPPKILVSKIMLNKLYLSHSHYSVVILPIAVVIMISLIKRLGLITGLIYSLPSLQLHLIRMY